MTAVTQCPECGTSFKITEAQIVAHDGLVRCGRCHVVFHAHDPVFDDEPSPQLNLPIEFEPLAELPGLTHENKSALGQTDLKPIHDEPKLGGKPKSLAEQIEFIEELTDEIKQHPPRRRDWKPFLMALLLSLTLVAQFVYFFRVEITARLPGLRPLLTHYCNLLSCSIGLPQDIQQLVIESSDLESDPKLGNIITLHALLHNRAAYAQTYPSLELTLTDMQDLAVARKIFHPANYLKTETEENQGIAANRDLEISLHLDTTDLNPAGYRLFLFYPQ